METLAALANGFAVAFTPINLFWSALGVTVGTAVGVLPGIGPALTVALLLPVTYNLEPTSAFIMFAGIYYGAMYGGSTTAILLNTPGESGSIVTAIDGHEMARKGRGAQALATAAIGSFIAGTIATVGADLRRAADGQDGAAVRPGRVLRADGPGADHRHGRARAPRCRVVSPACSSAWPWGWSASTSRPGRRASPSAFPNCSTASTRSWSRSACSRSARPSTTRPATASRRRRSTPSRARSG